MWNLREVHEALFRGLRAREEELSREQSVRGLDALDETQLHPLLADALLAAGWGVQREALYPTSAGIGEALKRPKHRDRERCDLVVLPSPHVSLADPIAKLREGDRWADSLFATVLDKQQEPTAATLTKPTVPASDACWLEVKVVGQFAFINDVPIANSAYASQLTTGLAADLTKITCETAILHGAALLVLFTTTPEIATHDITLAMHRVLDRGVTLRSPIIDSFPILDRIGNATCSLVLVQP